MTQDPTTKLEELVKKLCERDRSLNEAEVTQAINELIISELKDLIKFEKLDITKLTGIEAIKVTDVLQRIDQLSKSKRSE